MQFAKIVFAIAAVWGIVLMAPMYFLFDKVGESSPPAVTHPEFYYGFVGVTLAWQLAFAVIATDPIRFRLVILPALFEKGSYVAAMIVLGLQNRITAFQFSTAVPDALLGVLFVVAFFKTRPAPSS